MEKSLNLLKNKDFAKSCSKALSRQLAATKNLISNYRVQKKHIERIFENRSLKRKADNFPEIVAFLQPLIQSDCYGPPDSNKHQLCSHIQFQEAH